MRHHTIFAIACLCSAAAIVSAIPLPANNQELDLLQIPLTDGKEIDVLTLGSKDQEQMIAERNKRTIGLLRELFPDITKEIDSIVNRIIAQVIRVAGPSLLPALLGNNNRGAGGGGTTERSSFDADFDDDDDNDDSGNDINANGANGQGTRVQVDLPTFPPDSTGTGDNGDGGENDVNSRSIATNDANRQIDDQANRIISKLLRTLGPTVLRTAVQGNSATQARTTFDADFDDDDDDNSSSTGSSSTSSGSGTRVSIELPTFSPEDEDAASNSVLDGGDDSEKSTTTTTTTEATKWAKQSISLHRSQRDIFSQSAYTKSYTPCPSQQNGATDTEIDLSAINKQLEETIRVARQVKEAEAAAAASAATQAVAASQQLPQQLPIPQPKREETIQLSFNNEVSPLTNNNDNTKPVGNDLQLSESKSPAIDELSLDSNEDTADLDDRNKRFLSFGGAGLAGGASGGSNAGAGGAGGAGAGAGAGGSGNFLFDIVRLFSGSVQTQTGDEANNSGNSVASDSYADTDANRAADGYTEGIPGPVTRLVVLANRGLANLIQDLILRIAATSEKFVNFKAKLITALI